MSGSKNPSNNTRFKKGQSGNPNGRPKSAKEKQVSAFDIVVDRTLTVTQNGMPREMTVEEALQHQTYREAIGGSRMAQREIFKMIAKREKARAARDDRISPFVQRRLEIDPDNADGALIILGIATHDESRNEWADKREPLLLEPWAVQAALTRRRGGEQLRTDEIVEIKQRTRNGEGKLRWPRGGEND